MAIITSLEPLLQSPHVVVGLDAYGVIYNGKGIFDHSKEVILFCQKHDIPLYMMTNNATCSPIDISNQMHDRGISISPDYIISSGCGCYLLDDIKRRLVHRNVFVYGYQASQFYPREAGAIITENIDDAECIVMAASLNQANDDMYDRCYQFLKQSTETPVICINPDHYVVAKDTFLPVMGYYAHQMASQLSRDDFIWMGKPYSIFSRLVQSVLQSNGHDVRHLIFCDDNPLNVQQMVQDLSCTGCAITDTGVFSKYQSMAQLDGMNLISHCKL